MRSARPSTARSFARWRCTPATPNWQRISQAHFRRRIVERRVSRRVSAGVQEAIAGPDPADVLAVRAAVHALPPRRRAIVVLRFEAGLPLAEIADVLHISIGTVKSQLHDAVATLRTTLRIEEEHHVH